MNKNYRFRLYPSKAQELEMLETLEECRKLYNNFLGAWKHANDNGEKVPKKYDLQAQIPGMVKEYDPLKNVHSKTRQYVLWQLYSNLTGLRSLKAKGRKAGKIRFKKYGRYKSFVYNQTGFKLLDNKLHLSIIGDILIKQHREITGKIKQVVIKKMPSGKWFAIFSVESEQYILPPTGKAIGLDLNIQNYVTDNNGTKVDHPHTTDKFAKRLAIEQRKLAKKKKGSRNRLKQRLRVARVYEKVVDSRTDFLHKLSLDYIQNYDLIAVEDLSVKEMMESPQNSKNKADSAWSTFLQMLSYKAEEAGRTVVRVDPKNTTQMCSKCGTRVYKQIWIRTHKCPECGLILDRDHNAAINILNKALLEVGSVRPELTPVEMRPLLPDSGLGASLVEESGISSLGEVAR